jgi:hypothetical protein
MVYNDYGYGEISVVGIYKDEAEAQASCKLLAWGGEMPRVKEYDLIEKVSK